MEIKSCCYYDDDGVIEVIYADRRQVSILCHRIEESLDLTPMMKSKFIWLLYNEPETLAELHLSGELERFLESYGKSYNEQERDIQKSLEKHYSPSIAGQIAREFMMYDS